MWGFAGKIRPNRDQGHSGGSGARPTREIIIPLPEMCWLLGDAASSLFAPRRLMVAGVQLVSRRAISSSKAAIHSPAAASSGTAEIRTLLVAARLAVLVLLMVVVVVVVLTPGSP